MNQATLRIGYEKDVSYSGSNGAGRSGSVSWSICGSGSGSVSGSGNKSIRNNIKRSKSWSWSGLEIYSDSISWTRVGYQSR